MAPAPIAGAPPRARTGRQATWTREEIIERIQRWSELFGEPPRAADWNPAAARWSDQTWRVARYRAGDPETGAAWPSLNVAKRAFGGSLRAAVAAPGLEAAPPGPKRRARLASARATRDPAAAAVALEAVAAAALAWKERLRSS
jgi:hypothetical protein